MRFRSSMMKRRPSSKKCDHSSNPGIWQNRALDMKISGVLCKRIGLTSQKVVSHCTNKRIRQHYVPDVQMFFSFLLKFLMKTGATIVRRH